MEELIVKLTKVLAAMLTRVNTLESQVKELQDKYSGLDVRLADATRHDEIKKNKLHKKSYEVWKQIQLLHVGMMPNNRIAELLHLSPSTVSSYVNTPEEKALLLPHDKEIPMKSDTTFVSKLEEKYGD